MTVCIAGIAMRGRAVVIATDTMLSMGFAKADEAASKIWGVHPNWAAMFAGSTEHVAPVLRAAREQLETLSSEPSYSDVERAFVKAYQERLREQESNAVLGQFGLSLNEFLSEGRQKFGDTMFSQLFSEIRQVMLGYPDGLSLLVAGYDDQGIAHIFSVAHPGVVQNHDLQGFWAIGSGQYVSVWSRPSGR